MPKDVFLTLLKRLVEVLQKGNGKFNLINRFRKCGIVLCNVNELLVSLPKAPSCNEDDAAAMDESLVNILTEMRQDRLQRARKSRNRVYAAFCLKNI